MLCLPCRTQPHQKTDCEYPVSCTCQHKMNAVIVRDEPPLDEKPEVIEKAKASV